MKNAKNLSLRSMKETIVNYSGSQNEFDKIWDAYYQMAVIGFISQDTWRKFFEQCRGWYVDEEHACVRDECHCYNGVDTVVWEYSEHEYKA